MYAIGPPGALFTYAAEQGNDYYLKLFVSKGCTITKENMNSRYWTAELASIRKDYLRKMFLMLTKDKEVFTSYIPKDIIDETFKFL
jgi:hypothetical protein